MNTLDEIKFKRGARRKAGMTVPEGFFEQFQQQLEAKIDTLEAVKPAPVVEMPRRNTFTLRAMIAASVVALVALGIGTYYLLADDPWEDFDTQFAKIDSVADGSEMEDVVVGSVNDYDLYEYYCEL